MQFKLNLYNRNFQMKKTFFLLIFASTTTFSQVDPWGFQMELCEMNSKWAAPLAGLYNARLETALSTTKPNSTQRKQALTDLELEADKFKNSMAENLRKFKAHLRDTERWDSAQISLLDSISDITLTFAEIVARQEPGKSSETYRRLIENKCKALVATPLNK